jgi:hypothetical protein
MNHTQFRLSNGDEIIAQVVQEPDGDDVNIVVRNAMMITRTENLETGYRYYSFRPWMSFQLNDEYLQLLNYSHIVGEAKPSKVLLEQYLKSIESQAEEGDISSPYDSDDAITIQRILHKLQQADNADSDSNNVVPLFNKDKLH